MLYDSQVIEKYLNIIKEYQNQGKILSTIRGKTFHYYESNKSSEIG